MGMRALRSSSLSRLILASWGAATHFHRLVLVSKQEQARRKTNPLQFRFAPGRDSRRRKCRVGEASNRNSDKTGHEFEACTDGRATDRAKMQLDFLARSALPRIGETIAGAPPYLLDLPSGRNRERAAGTLLASCAATS